MSLDSLQRASDIDTSSPLVRKGTETLLRSQTSGRNLPVIGLRSRDHFTARSLNALCDPEYSLYDGDVQHGVATVENVPSATQSDNGFIWNGQHQKPGRNSSGSPLVVEMAREIERLKNELAALQSGHGMVDGDRWYGVEQTGGGMVKSGNLVTGKDVFGDNTPSPLKSDQAQSLLIHHPSYMSPIADRETGKQDLGVKFTGDGPDGLGMWSEDVVFEPDHEKLDVNRLPLVLELRAQVARLQDQLRSASVNNSLADPSAPSAILPEKHSDVSGNVAEESKTVAHLRRVIQVRNTVLHCHLCMFS